MRESIDTHDQYACIIPIAAAARRQAVVPRFPFNCPPEHTWSARSQAPGSPATVGTTLPTAGPVARPSNRGTSSSRYPCPSVVAVRSSRVSTGDNMFRWDGARQRTLRQAAGQSPEQLAIAINRSASAIISYEIGRTTPPVGVAHQLARELGVTVADLLTEQGVTGNDGR